MEGYAVETYNKSNDNIYTRAINGADISIWEWDVEKDTLFISSNFKNITGYDPKYFKNPMDFIEKLVIENEITQVKDSLNCFVNENGSNYNREFKIKSKKGELIYLLVKGKSTKNSDGKIRLISGCICDITSEKLMEDDINYLSHYRPFINLPNKSSFRNHLKMAVKNSKQGALLLLNIDNFKLINDHYDYNFGDMLLTIFSRSMSMFVKDFGKLYYLNGNEFIILISHFNSEEGLKRLCNRIMNYLKNPFCIMGENIFLTVSIGISIFPTHSRNINKLYKYADIAMCKSKSSGKNTVTMFTKSLHDSYSRRLIIEQSLKNAIKDKELRILYQPQIDAFSHKLVGFESLLRWDNNKLGFVSPSEFIPIAEDTGSIIDIGYWIFESVCNTIHNLQLKNIDIKKISVNVCSYQLSEPEFIKRVLNICKKYKVSPSMIQIEITERTLIDIFVNKTKILDEILDMGMQIALDDFGTGYSSLNYLISLPVSTLKIDKSFIDNIYSKKSKAVIKCIIDLSKILNYNIIAEGVETKEQLNSLLDIGCSVIQGYYFSKPIKENEIEHFVNKKIKCSK
ncbi:GGDEF and EAL domain-containing protein [Clostridium sp. cel8]|jgi:diguanylate cyclase (GGDEF)-like protein/PAS domain S-box-containing protein|nr:GGDEF and EAL domain-containing protein [Clostridium sp. cel8]MBA5851053.1 GGDEF and EAL domain-containing protein [Clostridium sp. cel8]